MKREETFTSVLNLRLENSFGVLAEEDNVEVEITVGIHDGEETGWFEMYDIESGGEEWYAEGGLWLEDQSVTGYDGVFALPTEVTDKLKEWGYDVTEVEC